jgi:hypothetical protein
MRFLIVSLPLAFLLLIVFCLAAIANGIQSDN